MKKKLFVIAVLVAVAAVVFSGCSLTLASPSLSYDADTGAVSWRAIPFADEYSVAVYAASGGQSTGELLTETVTSDTRYYISDYGEFYVEVTALSSRFTASEASGIAVRRVSTESGVIVDPGDTQAAEYYDMLPLVPFFYGYYYDGCGSVRIPLNSDEGPVSVTGRFVGEVSESDRSFEGRTLILDEEVFASCDPGQTEMFTVTFADGSEAVFRIDVAQERTATAIALVCPIGLYAREVFEIYTGRAPVGATLDGADVGFVYDDTEGTTAFDTSLFEYYGTDGELDGERTYELALDFGDGDRVVYDVFASAHAGSYSVLFGDRLCVAYDRQNDSGDVYIGLSGTPGQSGTVAGLISDRHSYAISVDGTFTDDRTDVLFGTDRDYVQLRESMIKDLEPGMHYIEIYTAAGTTGIYLYVYSGQLVCYDLYFDFDESYPDIVLGYSCDVAADRYEVVVGGTSYDSESHPEMFADGKVILTDVIERDDTVYLKSYYGESEAVSETLTFGADVTAMDQYLDPSRGYVYLGEATNTYIDSMAELERLAQYMLLYYDDLPKQTYELDSGSTEMGYMRVYVDLTALGIVGSSPDRSLLTLFNNDACDSYKEAYSITTAVVRQSAEVFEIAVCLRSATEPSISCETDYTERGDTTAHLTSSSRSADFENFAINERTRTAEVTTSDQLYFAVEQGYLPVPVAGSAAERIYEKAKDVCRTYIDDDMTDGEKVHAFYDWLGVNVIYDYDTATAMNGISPSSDEYLVFYRYNCFFLEGVFDDGVAVCNGIAKAFVLLCGIEGIDCVKVNGVSRNVAHAWNKVNVDGVWYIVDSTWSNVNNGDNTESFTHEYLMISTPQSDPTSGHREQSEDTLVIYAPDGQYNVFSNTYFVYGDHKGNYYISDLTEFAALMDMTASTLGIGQSVSVNVACGSYAELLGYLESAQTEVGYVAHIDACCSHYSDSDANGICDNCGSGEALTVTLTRR